MAAERAVPVESGESHGHAGFGVEHVGDDGVVVLVSPDGKRRAANVPPNLVSLIRRLQAIKGQQR